MSLPNGASERLGRLALEFVNTRRTERRRMVDLLATPEDLLGWLAAAGSPSEEPSGGILPSPPEARGLLLEAQRLRSALLGLLECRAAERPLPPLDLRTLNRILEASRMGHRLEPTEEGLRLLAHETAPFPSAALAPVALSAGRLLSEAEPARLRRCASPTCGLWFLDVSKNGRRKWCSMARCGNRAKAARQYRRRAASA